jgi:hypothetical protein
MTTAEASDGREEERAAAAARDGRGVRCCAARDEEEEAQEESATSPYAASIRRAAETLLDRARQKQQQQQQQQQQSLFPVPSRPSSTNRKPRRRGEGTAQAPFSLQQGGGGGRSRREDDEEEEDGDREGSDDCSEGEEKEESDGPADEEGGGVGGERRAAPRSSCARMVNAVAVVTAVSETAPSSSSSSAAARGARRPPPPRGGPRLCLWIEDASLLREAPAPGEGGAAAAAASTSRAALVVLPYGRLVRGAGGSGGGGGGAPACRDDEAAAGAVPRRGDVVALHGLALSRSCRERLLEQQGRGGAGGSSPVPYEFVHDPTAFLQSPSPAYCDAVRIVARADAASGQVRSFYGNEASQPRSRTAHYERQERCLRVLVPRVVGWYLRRHGKNNNDNNSNALRRCPLPLPPGEDSGWSSCRERSVAEIQAGGFGSGGGYCHVVARVEAAQEHFPNRAQQLRRSDANTAASAAAALLVLLSDLSSATPVPLLLAGRDARRFRPQLAAVSSSRRWARLTRLRALKRGDWQREGGPAALEALGPRRPWGGAQDDDDDDAVLLPTAATTVQPLEGEPPQPQGHRCSENGPGGPLSLTGPESQGSARTGGAVLPSPTGAAAPVLVMEASIESISVTASAPEDRGGERQRGVVTSAPPPLVLTASNAEARAGDFLRLLDRWEAALSGGGGAGAQVMEVWIGFGADAKLRDSHGPSTPSRSRGLEGDVGPGPPNAASAANPRRDPPARRARGDWDLVRGLGWAGRGPAAGAAHPNGTALDGIRRRLVAGALREPVRFVWILRPPARADGIRQDAPGGAHHYYRVADVSLARL